MTELEGKYGELMFKAERKAGHKSKMPPPSNPERKIRHQDAIEKLMQDEPNLTHGMIGAKIGLSKSAVTRVVAQLHRNRQTAKAG